MFKVKVVATNFLANIHSVH